MRACTLGLVLVFALIGANGASQISVRNKNLNSIGELLDTLTSKLLLEETQMHDRVVERKGKADTAFAQKVHQEEAIAPIAKNVSALMQAAAAAQESAKTWEARVKQASAVIDLTKDRHQKEAGTAENNKKMITEITGLIKVFKSYKGAETPEAKSTLADISTKFSELSNTQTDFLEAESFLPNKFNQISVVEDLLKIFANLNDENKKEMQKEVHALKLEHEKTTATLNIMKGSQAKIEATLLEAQTKLSSAKAAHAASVAFYLGLDQEYQQCQADFRATADTIKRERSIIDMLEKKISQFKLIPADQIENGTAHASQSPSTISPTSHGGVELDLQMAMNAARSALKN